MALSFLDDAKNKAGDLADRAKGLVAENGESIKNGIEKGGDFIDQKTGGKFAEKVDKVQDGASGLVDKLGGRDTEN